MSDLSDILQKRNFQEPPELVALKKYVSEKFKVTISVAIRDDTIVVTTGSASLANTLRLHGPQITEACNLSRRLTFKIG